MNPLLRSVGLPFFLALPLVAAHAAFNPRLVSADAQWVVYADLGGLRGSAVGRQLIATLEQTQRLNTKGLLGLDFQKVAGMVGAVTASGSNFSTAPATIDGSLVIEGTPDLRKIVEAALVQATVTTPDRVQDVTDLPFPAYAISMGGGKAPALAEVIVAFPPEPIVIVSRSKPQLLKIHDVFLGKSPSLAQSTVSPVAGLLSHAAGALFFAASKVPPEQMLPPNAPQARILQMASAGSIALGEEGANTFAHLELIASSEPMADKLTKILQGMAAMLSLTETNDQKLAEFLNAAQVGRNGTAVTLDVSYPSARIVEMVQNARREIETPPPAPAPSGAVTLPAVQGSAVAQWAGDEGAGPGGAPAAGALVWRTIDNVPLVNGSTVTLTGLSLTGRPVDGRNARFDRIEIAPAHGGGAPLVFRAEYMKLSGFRIENAPAASQAGRIASARAPFSTAQFQFPGADGSYTLRIAYLNAPPGTTTFIVSTKDPAAPAPGADAVHDAAPGSVR